VKNLSESSRYRWVVLFASFFAFVAFAFVFQLMPPLLKRVISDFGVGDAQAGLLMSMVMLPGIFLALPAGWVINRYRFRAIGFLALILVAIGSLTTALASVFSVALIGRFILGVGGAFIVVGTPTLIPQWFSRKELGKAMGFFGTNMPFATVLAFPVASVLAASFGWRFLFYLGTVTALAVALLFVVVVREGPLKSQHSAADVSEVKQAIKSVEIWKVSLVWMFFNVTALAFLSWAPTLFQDFKGLEPFHASLLASALMYAALVFVPIFGWASDKVGRRKPFLVLGSVLLALTLIASAYAFDLGLLLSVIVLGVAAAMIPPIVMTIPPQNLPPHLAGTGFSIVTLCQNIGVSLSAPLAGYLIQTTHSLSLTFIGLSLFAFAGAIAALTLRTK